MSKAVQVGFVPIGGGNPVTVQSMTNTKTSNISATVDQIQKLTNAGCDLVRVSVPDQESAEALKEISSLSRIPVIADIHFDHRLAIESIRNGAAKVRINPGNIGQEWKVIETVKVAREYGVPIRVGANSGSLDRNFGAYDRPVALAESALAQVRILEGAGFEDIVISLKSSSVTETVSANEYLFEKTDYPLHLGVTEAGFGLNSTVKSSIGIGTLLLKGIGDTIRVSMSGDPVQEIEVGLSILKSLGLRRGVNVISCPTCARTEIDVEALARKVKNWVGNVDADLSVAVMGCVVNGIGEGSEADIGIAGTASGGVIFVRGEIVEKVGSENLEARFRHWFDELLSGGDR